MEDADNFLFSARDMLCAVSYEDIVKLTQMAAHLPDTSLASKYPSNRTHQRQRSGNVHIYTLYGFVPSLT